MQELYYPKSRETFAGHIPSEVIRAPGRVNLIGEHTDYNGLPVLPIAIDREIRLEISPRDDSQVILVNKDRRFAPRSFSLDHGERLIPYELGDWGNYVKAGLQGIMDEFGTPGIGVRFWKGFSAIVSGNIPIASGLSSSSALVVASSIAFMAANNLEMDRVQLAEIMASAERYVGTEGGGMDQAICLLAESGHALKIDFFPLRAKPVKMPNGYRIVVCKSMIEAPKTREARMKYNRRPIECRLACAIMNKKVETLSGERASFNRVGDMVNGLEQDLLNKELLPVLETQVWTETSLCDYLELDLAELQERFFILSDGSRFPQPQDGFKLAQRVRHVISEAQRVEEAAVALEEGSIERVGRLMNESHISCRDDYEISCEELDALVAISREAGAIGSRLTGAGFGGCTVSLVKEDRVFDFVQSVKEGYYESYLKDKHPDIYGTIDDYSEVIFICNPSDGANRGRFQGSLIGEGVASVR